MVGSEAPPPQRVQLPKDELERLSKEELIAKWKEQESYVEYLESQAGSSAASSITTWRMSQQGREEELVSLRESEEKLKQQQLEATRRENVLVMRLTTKEQEMQECAHQIQELKGASVATGWTRQLRAALLDPAVNLLFERMRREVEAMRTRLEETQNELSAWKFTPDRCLLPPPHYGQRHIPCSPQALCLSSSPPSISLLLLALCASFFFLVSSAAEDGLCSAASALTLYIPTPTPTPTPLPFTLAPRPQRLPLAPLLFSPIRPPRLPLPRLWTAPRNGGTRPRDCRGGRGRDEDTRDWGKGTLLGTGHFWDGGKRSRWLDARPYEHTLWATKKAL